MSRKIVIEIQEVKPPIPLRMYDYRATYGRGNSEGWGVTAWEALNDLIQKIEENGEEHLV